MFHRNALLDSQGSKILIQASRNYKNGKLKNRKKYLLQRGVPTGNNACKANLIEKGIFTQKLDLPIQTSQEKH